jgi:peptidoglycan hydrolase-like protein with peptidoglycan-binding domain
VAVVADVLSPETTAADAPATSIAAEEAPAPAPAPIELAALSYIPPAPIATPAVEVPLIAVGKTDGAETARVQARLLELGFWLQATDGDYGLTTAQAVMAFQKYHGIDATASVDEQTATMLSAAGERATGLADAGILVEIDKSRQLVFIVQDGLAVWTLNSSTGSEIPYEAVNDKDPTKIEKGDAVTPVGLYHTERERPEGWWAGDLGEIYRPKYFVGGIAVHGSNSIPNYPASHGCVRVSVPAMDFIWETDLMPLGIKVWVHGEIPAT